MTAWQESDVIRGLREGKVEAWHALYEAHAEIVWRIVARLLGPESSDVADVVQETFLAAARSASSFDPARGSLQHWLGGIARRNVALHYRRRQQSDRLISQMAQRGVGPDRDLSMPDAGLETSELAEQVREVLLHLPIEYESVLTAKYLDGVSVEQIADRECSSPTAVRSRLARARQAFRALFGRPTILTPERSAGDRNEP